MLITSERAQRAERVLSYLREKSEYSRPGPARPGPTPSRSLTSYISGTACLIDKRSSLMNTTWNVKVVWHGYHIASVPVMARGACQTWGTLDDPQNTLPQLPHNGWTDLAETWYTARHSTDNSCLWVIFGVLQHVRTCTPRFYISRTAEPIAPKFGM